MSSPSVIDAIKEKLSALTEDVERAFDGDVVGLFGPILGNVEQRVRRAVEQIDPRRRKLVVILQTPGGSIEVTERIVNTIRHHYPEVVFVIPDVALSAGTILAMSGDAIFMDYFSCLGPIDPQVERDGKLVPALSYLEQFERLVARSQAGLLTTAEIALLNKLDLAELHTFEQQKELTTDLLVYWLTRYKFKDWVKTNTRGVPVTPEMREVRAREISESLNDHRRWRSHGRGISMKRVRDELKLVVDDFGERPEMARPVRAYFDFVINLMLKEGMNTFVTSKAFV